MNSLKQYYRKPSLYIEIPSNGKYFNSEYDEGKRSILNEVGVLPMTLMNQLTVNNPESLLNGSAIEELIRDCTDIEGIEPRKLYKCDIDALMIAIRKVSYEDEFEVEVECPEASCGKVGTYNIDLGIFLHTMTKHDNLPYTLDITLGEDQVLTLNLLPSTLEQNLKLEQMFLHDSREIQELKKKLDNISDDLEYDENEVAMSYIKEIQEVHRRMTMQTVTLYADSILSVTTPDGDVVDDREEIEGLVMELTQHDHDRLKNKIAEINAVGIDKSYNFECDSCGHKFKEDIQLNPVDFFGNGSR